MPSKFRLFWSLLWAKIRGASKWLLSVVLLVVILIIALIGFNANNKKTDTTNQPEVAQVYEPSIGTPLPADTTPSDNSGSTSTDNQTGQVEGTTTTDTAFLAPKTGVDPSEPIKYENSSLGITATIPAGSDVKETTNSVTFFSNTGSLLYSLNVVTGSDSLESITQQLKASPDVSKVIKTTFADNSALQFSTKNQVGYAISKNNKIYYLIGYDKYLTNISI